DVQTSLASTLVRRWCDADRDQLVLRELETQRARTNRKRRIGGGDLLPPAEIVVDVLQHALLYVQRVGPERRSVRKQHTACVGFERYFSENLERSPAYVDGHRFGHFERVRHVDVTLAWRAELRSGRRQNGDCTPVL